MERKNNDTQADRPRLRPRRTRNPVVHDPPHAGALAYDELDDTEAISGLSELVGLLTEPDFGGGCVLVPAPLRRITKTGDQALCLAQIIYWFRPASSNGKPRARIFKGGKRWLAKTHEQLGEEVGLSGRQVKACLSALRTLGLIE